jgi:hypothetical protein
VDESYGKEIMNNLVRLVMMMILVMVHHVVLAAQHVMF